MEEEESKSEVRCMLRLPIHPLGFSRNLFTFSPFSFSFFAQLCTHKVQQELQVCPIKTDIRSWPTLQGDNFTINKWSQSKNWRENRVNYVHTSLDLITGVYCTNFAATSVVTWVTGREGRSNGSSTVRERQLGGTPPRPIKLFVLFRPHSFS